MAQVVEQEQIKVEVVKMGYGFLYDGKKIEKKKPSRLKQFLKNREDKRVSKFNKMDVKTKRLSKENKSLATLEKAKRTRTDIKHKAFDRRAEGIKEIYSNIIKAKGTRNKKKVSSSPFDPSKW